MFHKRIVFQKSGFEDLKKDYTFIDMHIHSKYSHDCMTPVSAILKKAKKLGIGIGIADHVRAEGSLAAGKQKKVLVIPAIEINSSEGKEILLYFYSFKDLKEYYDKYIKRYITIKKEHKKKITQILNMVIVNKKMSEIIEQADNYNCLKSIPHPYTYLPRRSHRFFASKKRKNLLRKIQAIEVLNATMTMRRNRSATKWARKTKKAFTAGSDAHVLKEIGEAIVGCRSNKIEGFLECIRKKNNLVVGEEIKFSTKAREFMITQRYKTKTGIKKIQNID